MTAESSRPRRFGADFVEAHRHRYGKRPPQDRQLTYDIAVQDEHAAWRQWLDDQLALLPDQASEALANKVWLDEHFWPVNFELATGAGLRAAGLRTVYEEAWDGLSPDWTVLSDSGTPLAFVEVHTDMPAPEMCVPKTCATWAYAPQLAVGLVPRLAPGGQVSAWPGVR